MGRSLRVLTVSLLLALVSGCSSKTDDSAAQSADTGSAETIAAAVSTESVAAETVNAETTAVAPANNETTLAAPEVTVAPLDSSVPVSTAAGSSIGAGTTGPSTFSLIAAAKGSWPNPVPKTYAAIGDLDNEALCKQLSEGGAFPGVGGEYYAGNLNRTGDTLNFECQYRDKSASPVSLDGFAGAFVTASLAPGEQREWETVASFGLVNFTLVGDPLAAIGSDEIFRAADRGCVAGATAVGLPPVWAVETLGSVNDNKTVTCKGPVPNPLAVEVDTAILAKIVGASSPPKD